MIIRSIDFETTGIPTPDDPHAIVEIGAVDITLDNDSTSPVLSTTFSTLCNPGRPIPHEAMAVHHITDAMVADASGNLGNIMGDNVGYYCAHNADYERQFFEPGIPYICTYKVALRLWPDAPSHGLQFLRYHLSLPVVNADVFPPHRAGPDAYLGAALMVHILNDGRASLDEMVRWTNGPALLPRVNFGKHKGSKWEDVPADYLEWLAFKSDMDRDIKANAKHHLSKRGF